MSAPVTVTDASFQQEVLDSHLPVLVDFWATWCPPCKLIAPIVEDFATEFAGRMKVAKVDYDTCPAIAGRFQVMSIPTLMVFQDGQPVGRLVGYQPKAALREKLERILSHSSVNASAGVPAAE
jgi:thioredoxin 1